MGNASFFDMMKVINGETNHPSIATESAIVMDNGEFTVAEEGFFRDSKTPPKMVKKADGDMVKYISMQGNKANQYIAIPNEKWPKELLVRNDRVLDGFSKNGADFSKKYVQTLHKALDEWKRVKGSIKDASMANSGEKWEESMTGLKKIFSDMSAVNRNFNGWTGSPMDVTDQFRNKMVPTLTDFQKLYEDVIAEWYEMKGNYMQKSTISRAFKYGTGTYNTMIYGINEIANYCDDLWAFISRGIV